MQFRERIKYCLGTLSLVKYSETGDATFLKRSFAHFLDSGVNGYARGFAAYAFLLESEHGGVDEAAHFSVAELLYKHAADEGDYLALGRLSFLKQHKRPGIALDWSMADDLRLYASKVSLCAKQSSLLWIEHLANREYAPAQLLLANFALSKLCNAEDSADAAAAFRWCDRSLTKNSTPAAQNLLGSLYVNGVGVGRNPKVGLKYYLKAAESGESAAMYNIGTLYERGLGVEHDFGTACLWYQRAADLGSPNAENVIGIFYETGELGEPDARRALIYYFRAALSGHPHASHNIGRIFHEGLGGIAADQQFAEKCYFRAASQNHAQSMTSYAIFRELAIISKTGGLESLSAKYSSEQESRLEGQETLRSPRALKRVDSVISLQSGDDSFKFQVEQKLAVSQEVEHWLCRAAQAGEQQAQSRLLYAQLHALLPAAYYLFNDRCISHNPSALQRLPNELKMRIILPLFSHWVLSQSQIDTVVEKVATHDSWTETQMFSVPYIAALLKVDVPNFAERCECARQSASCTSLKHYLKKWTPRS